ncbi:septum site-determining protein Ssd [Amycolatopsis jiangsuensis]|uniref:Secretion/DNA translocation related CpaE-like protein n=1 Tax=Amycolatopsis jiangsuensis TaxID=1181879 RepID=A0A840J1W0_9PSEU|nr:septum site-determining protein Ssd [Amycolatopsis jiangsuensis]MBB4687739.1 secretion/DNA translocation related CpaE-like protein [Amycolatopsis jiangsuensis]
MATARPLVVAADGTVFEEIQRVAAIAGSELDHAPDLAAARARWTRAPLVVIEEDAAADRPALPRRDGVMLICKGAAGLESWQRAATVGARRVIRLPEDESELAVAFADVADAPAESPGPVVAVVGGRGGAGASVLAAAIAVEADRSGPALLVDCDPLGGGLDLPLGLEHAKGLRWPEVRLSGRVSMPSLVASLPCRGRLPVLSCGRSGPGPSPRALSAIVAAGRRAGRTVVCDLPRYLDDGALAVASAADLVVLVVPVEFRACMAAQQVLRRVGTHADRLAIVASGHSVDGAPPSRTAALLGPPLLAALTPERRVAATLETGEFELPAKGPLVGAARSVLAELRSASSDAIQTAA